MVIEGGDVFAQGINGGAGIGGGDEGSTGTIALIGGRVKAAGWLAIGNGDGGSQGTITLGNRMIMTGVDWFTRMETLSYVKEAELIYF